MSALKEPVDPLFAADNIFAPTVVMKPLGPQAWAIEGVPTISVKDSAIAPSAVRVLE